MHTPKPQPTWQAKLLVRTGIQQQPAPRWTSAAAVCLAPHSVAYHKVTSKGPKTFGRTPRGCGLCLAMASAHHGLPLPWFLGLTAQLVPHTQALLQQTDKAAKACVPRCKFECCDWHCTDHNGPPFLCRVALHSKSAPQHSWDMSQYSCHSWCAVSEDAGT
jgi:hypothetical protein